MNIKTLAVNGIVAALYIAVTFVFSHLDFQMSNFVFPRCLIILLFLTKSIFTGLFWVYS